MSTDYSSALRSGRLSQKPIDDLLAVLGKHVKLSPLPRELVGTSQLGPRFTASLTRLSLHVARGLESWSGLVVGFPGTRRDLTTEAVGTPYLREILYPILDLRHRLQQHTGHRMPCIYLLGDRFSDVFIRKFRLLTSITPHVLVMSSDVLKSAMRGTRIPSRQWHKVSEAWIQRRIVDQPPQ